MKAKDLVIGKKYKLISLREAERIDNRDDGPTITKEMVKIFDVYSYVTVRSITSSGYIRIGEDDEYFSWMSEWLETPVTEDHFDKDLFKL